MLLKSEFDLSSQDLDFWGTSRKLPVTRVQSFAFQGIEATGQGVLGGSKAVVHGGSPEEELSIVFVLHFNIFQSTNLYNLQLVNQQLHRGPTLWITPWPPLRALYTHRAIRRKRFTSRCGRAVAEQRTARRPSKLSKSTPVAGDEQTWRCLASTVKPKLSK